MPSSPPAPPLPPQVPGTRSSCWPGRGAACGRRGGTAEGTAGQGQGRGIRGRGQGGGLGGIGVWTGCIEDRAGRNPPPQCLTRFPCVARVPCRPSVSPVPTTLLPRPAPTRIRCTTRLRPLRTPPLPPTSPACLPDANTAAPSVCVHASAKPPPTNTLIYVPEPPVPASPTRRLRCPPCVSTPQRMSTRPWRWG